MQGHEADFRARRGFTYTVLDPTESRCLGCVYAYPPEDDDGGARDSDAVVWFWVRPDGAAPDLDRRLVAALVPWRHDDFAFTRVRFRARADDERRVAILGEAGLRMVNALPVRGSETVLFA